MQDMTKEKKIQRMTNPGLLLQRMSILALESLIPTEVTSLCYRYCKPFVKGHLKNCKAIDVQCNYRGLKGHLKKCCKKAGNFPMNENSNKKNVHTATAHEAVDYYDEDLQLVQHF